MNRRTTTATAAAIAYEKNQAAQASTNDKDDQPLLASTRPVNNYTRRGTDKATA